jgi:hypothetical protein
MLGPDRPCLKRQLNPRQIMIGTIARQTFPPVDPCPCNPSGKSVVDPDLIIELIIGRLPGFFVAMRPIGVLRRWNVAGDGQGVLGWA